MPQDTNLTTLLLFQYRTVIVPVVKSPGFPKIPGKSLSFIYFAPDDENPEIHRPVFLELTPSPEMTYRTLPGTSNEMNVLGIVIFSATIGTCSGENGAPTLGNCCKSRWGCSEGYFSSTCSCSWGSGCSTELVPTPLSVPPTAELTKVLGTKKPVSSPDFPCEPSQRKHGS